MSRTGRDEQADLTLFRAGAEKYFQDADGALSAMADSFDRNTRSLLPKPSRCEPSVSSADRQPDAIVPESVVKRYATSR